MVFYGRNIESPPPPPITYDGNTMRSGEVIARVKSDVDAAKKSQTDMVKLLNPKPGTPDRMFCFPITPYNETSHEGMRMTHGKMMESLQFVKAGDNDRYASPKDARSTPDVMDYPVVTMPPSRLISSVRSAKLIRPGTSRLL